MQKRLRGSRDMVVTGMSNDINKGGSKAGVRFFEQCSSHSIKRSLKNFSKFSCFQILFLGICRFMIPTNWISFVTVLCLVLDVIEYVS